MIPLIIWIYHDINVIFCLCMLSDYYIIRKFYICYGALAFFAGLQIRVGLMVKCYEHCDSEDALFYLAILIPFLYGVAPSVMLLVYLVQLLCSHLSREGDGFMPSKSTMVLATVTSLVGAMGIVNLPAITDKTMLDTWTAKCIFFCVMLILVGATLLHKTHEEGKSIGELNLPFCK